MRAAPLAHPNSCWLSVCHHLLGSPVTPLGNAPVQHSLVIHSALLLGGEEWGWAWAEGGKGQSQGQADPEHVMKWDLEEAGAGPRPQTVGQTDRQSPALHSDSCTARSRAEVMGGDS